MKTAGGRPCSSVPPPDKVNVATLNQNNNAFGQNIAVGSAGVNQTLAQVQSNSAAVNQG